jgi:Peptidase M50B-like
MTAAALAAAVQRIGQVQPHLSGPGAVILAIVSLGATFFRAIWPITRHLTVLAHEGAHAVLASALGHKINGITVDRNGNGLTNHSGSSGALGLFSITFIGYLGPSAFGLGAAELIRIGHIVAVLWIGLAGLIAILFVIRKSFGILTVALVFLLLFAIAGFAAISVQVLTAYAVTWFLLVSGAWVIKDHGRNAADAGKLHERTKISPSFWSGIWQLGSLLALVFGAILLV